MDTTTVIVLIVGLLIAVIFIGGAAFYMGRRAGSQTGAPVDKASLWPSQPPARPQQHQPYAPPAQQPRREEVGATNVMPAVGWPQKQQGLMQPPADDRTQVYEPGMTPGTPPAPTAPRPSIKGDMPTNPNVIPAYRDDATMATPTVPSPEPPREPGKPAGAGPAGDEPTVQIRQNPKK
jgi:hypothetical protein